MVIYALLFGALLMTIGCVGYFSPATFGEYENVSPTALIPAGIGVLILLAGLVSVVKPSWRKHAMHVAALAGLAGFIGGFMPINKAQLNLQKASALAGLLLSWLSSLFLILCVHSFIGARAVRKESA
jgi:apolipoprotein N-acyltransferase